jgi:molybdenum cofactor guanylyltransferase
MILRTASGACCSPAAWRGGWAAATSACSSSPAGRCWTHAIARLQPQVAASAVNANGDPARFAQFGLPVVADVVAGFAGPLAGVLTGMGWLRGPIPRPNGWSPRPPTRRSFPKTSSPGSGRCPSAGAEVAFAASAGSTHPVFGLWRLASSRLAPRLVDEDERKIDRFAGRYRVAR